MRRHSIRTLIVFIVVSAISLAALRGADETWAGMLLLAALAAVGAAVLGAAILRGRERAWCAGFAFFGGGYLALTFGPWLSDSFEPRLGTTHLLRHVHGRMSPPQSLTKAAIAALAVEHKDLADQLWNARRLVRDSNDSSLGLIQKKLARVDNQLAIAQAIPNYDDFRQVGHSLFSILSGLIGAVVARRFYERQERIGAASSQA